MQLRMTLPRLKDALDKEKAFQLSSESVLGDADFMAEVLSFYR